MQTKPKLLILTTADISLNGLLKGQLHFLNQYYDVVGVAKDTGDLQACAEREGIRVINAPIERPISLLKDLKALFFLYRLFKKERPDILHANTPKGSLLAMIAGKLAGVPRRIYLVTGLRYQGASGLFRFILKSMEQITCLFATQVIPEGQGVMHCLQADHITRKPLRVLHYGNINGKDTQYLSCKQWTREQLQLPADADITDEQIASERAHVRQKLGFTDDQFVFVFIGRITRDKGMVELAHSMQKLDNRYSHVRLLLVGRMEDVGNAIPEDVRRYFKESAEVEYVGEQHDIRPYLFAADALVFPSYREGFPNVPMEAGCMELASIVTDINGCNEIVKDGLNGKIIQPRNESSLFATMSWFVEHPAEVKRMGHNARGIIHERYEQKDVWKALLEFYRTEP